MRFCFRTTCFESKVFLTAVDLIRDEKGYGYHSSIDIFQNKPSICAKMVKTETLLIPIAVLCATLLAYCASASEADESMCSKWISHWEENPFDDFQMRLCMPKSFSKGKIMNSD